MVDESPCGFLAALDFECEYRTATVGEVLLVQLVVGMSGQRRMVHLLHLGVLSQILHHLERVLYVTLYAQRQSFESLQQYPCVERRDGGTGVAQYDGADACHEGSLACNVGKYRTVIAWVGLGKCGIFVGIGFPVECAAVYDYASQTRTVAAYELSG